MVKLSGLVTESFGPVSVEVGHGETFGFQTESEYAAGVMMETLTGSLRPEAGSVEVMGLDLYAVERRKAMEVFRNVGVVWSDGGLISNLKVWENIALPAMYHEGASPASIEGRVVELLGTLGISGSYAEAYLSRLPGLLPRHERRIAGLVRAMVTEPGLMIYEDVFDGLTPYEAGRLAGVIVEFQQARAGRASVFVVKDWDSIDLLGVTRTVELLPKNPRR